MGEALERPAPNAALRIEPPRSILVVRALQLGDLLCAVPALRALRAAFPAACITLAGLPWAREFAARFERYVDAFIEFPGLPGLPERACEVEKVPQFIAEVRSRRFDLALQMHGSGQLLNPLVALLGARQCAGYCGEGACCPDPDRFLPWREDAHEILRYLELLRELGLPASDPRLEFPLSAEDRAERARLAAIHGLERGRYVCLHPGSQLPSRRWPARRFAAVGDRLAADGYRVVITGTAAESTLTEEVAARMHHIAVDMTGATTLGALAALVEHAALVVCNDTGISHIAAAMKTPSVVVCCGSDFRRWAPLDRERHRVLYHPVACRPCACRVCPIGHPCANGTEADRVIAEAQRMLATFSNFDASQACVG